MAAIGEITDPIVAALSDLLRNFAGNERVAKLTLVATLGGVLSAGRASRSSFSLGEALWR